MPSEEMVGCDWEQVLVLRLSSPWPHSHVSLYFRRLGVYFQLQQLPPRVRILCALVRAIPPLRNRHGQLRLRPELQQHCRNRR